jgi:hypothetical protein
MAQGSASTAISPSWLTLSFARAFCLPGDQFRPRSQSAGLPLAVILSVPG